MPEEGPGYLGVDETVTHDEDMEQALTQATTVLQSTWETGNRIKIIVVAGVKSSKIKKKICGEILCRTGGSVCNVSY